MSGRSRLCYCLSVLFLFFLFQGSAGAIEGDPERGSHLFVGQITFSNGGAPCLACHNASGVGMIGGANYGPDLTSLYENYGSEGIDAILQALPFPSMEKIYADRPLNESEQADLLAFFQQTSQLSSVPSSGKLALSVFIAVVVLLGLTILGGRKRKKATRQPLIDRQRNLLSKGERP